jgi:hypothetical protein
MAAKEGFFYWQKEEAKKRIIFALCMLQQSGADGGGGVGSQGHGNKCSGAKRGHFHVVAVSFPDRYL